MLAAYRKEGARLAATARAVSLVERALRGEVFTADGEGAPKAAGHEGKARSNRRGEGGLPAVAKDAEAEETTARLARQVGRLREAINAPGEPFGEGSG